MKSPLFPPTWIFAAASLLPLGAGAQTLPDSTSTYVTSNSDWITHWMTFPLEPGSLNWVERSPTMMAGTWAPQAYWWGFGGNDWADWPMYSIAKPDGQNTTPDPNFVPPVQVTMSLEFAPSGLIANWTSLDQIHDGNGDLLAFADRPIIRYQFIGTVPPDTLWASYPIFAHDAGGYRYTLMRFREDTPQNPIIPPLNPALGANDSQVAAYFLQSIDAITAEMQTAQSAAASFTPPPPSPDAQGFWRANHIPAALLDSDGDGLSNAYEAQHGSSWLSEDTDLDGLRDDIDPDPLVNEALADPDGAGLGDLNLTPAAGGNLVGRWDLEYFALEDVHSAYPDAPSGNVGVFPSSIPGQTGLRVDDPLSGSKWDGANNPAGIPSISVSLPGSGGFNLGSAAQLPSSLLASSSDFSFSFWVKLPENLFQAGSQSRVGGTWGGTAPQAYALLSIGEKTDYASGPTPGFVWALQPVMNVYTIGGQTYRSWGNGCRLTLERWKKAANNSLQLTRTELASWTISYPALSNGNWHHLVLRLDREGGTRTWLDNAELVRTSLLPANGGFPYVTLSDDVAAGTTYLEIGRFHPDDSRFTGMLFLAPDNAVVPGHLALGLDRVRVYNSLLGANEIGRLYNTDIDRDGLYDRLEAGNVLWRDWDGNGQKPTFTLASLFSGASGPAKEFYQIGRPFYHDPDDADHDDDGLPSLIEQQIGSDMTRKDTDGDFMPDGWEYDNLGPAAVIAQAGANQDSDLDDLKDIDEYRYNTNPLASDSDGDGKPDGLEIAEGSFPSHGEDQGSPVDNSQRFSFNVTAGDQSGSQSELYEVVIYRLDFQSGREIDVEQIIPGQISSVLSPVPVYLPAGNSYSFQLRWLSSSNRSPSSEDGPDYDYTFLVEPSGNYTPDILDSYDPETGLLSLEESIGGISDDIDSFPQTVQNLRQVSFDVKINVEEDQIGAIGNEVRSSLGENGLRHFVTPKKTDALPGDVVRLAAKGVPEQAFLERYHWVVDGEQLQSGRELTVSRQEPTKKVVELKDSEDKLIDSIVIWVVWCSASAPENIGNPTPSSSVEGSAGINLSGGEPAPQDGWYIKPPVQTKRFDFEVNPKFLITDADRPNFDLANESAPPGNVALQAGAIRKWDVSRRIRIKHVNSPNPTIRINHIWTNSRHVAGMNAVADQFPSQNVEVLFYPDDDIEGNDDLSATDEDNNPYSDQESLGPGFAPGGIGTLTSRDKPSVPAILQGAGQVDEKIEFRIHFGEFVRLEIGEGEKAKWFRVSDYLNWKVTQKFKKGNLGMADDGSESGNDNQGY